MNQTERHNLQLLRERIPVGLQHGMHLLKRTEGNVELAVRIYTEEVVSLLMHKTGLSSEAATRILVESDYDFGLAVQRAEETFFSLTERILSMYDREKETALDKIVLTVEQTYSLQRTYRFSAESLKNLSSSLYSFMIIMEWLYYADGEGFSSALTFQIEEVADSIGRTLGMNELADILTRGAQLRVVNAMREKESSGVFSSAEFEGEKELQSLEQVFRNSRQTVIDNLYAFVKREIHQFP